MNETYIDVPLNEIRVGDEVKVDAWDTLTGQPNTSNPAEAVDAMITKLEKNQ